MDAKTKGAWVVHHMNKLQQVTQATEYEAINEAGKLGTLLSALSASDDSRLSEPRVLGCFLFPRLRYNRFTGINSCPCYA
jgi:hypothetical protein